MIKPTECQKTLSGDDGEQPIWRRFFGNPVFFLVLFTTLMTLEAAAVYGYFPGVITTIERQFQISSTTVGTLTTISGFSSLSVLVFACYFGAKSHIPRVIGVGGILVGIGLLLTALPHAIFEPYQPAEGDYGNYYAQSADTNSTLLCSSDNVEQVCTHEETEDVKHGRLIDIWPIALGQVVMGFGSAALYPLGIIFMDDSTKDSSTTGLYVSILYLFASVGPFIGFSLCAETLSYRTDYYNHDDKGVQLDGSGSVGAWWLGFVIFGVLCIAVSIPIMFLPRKLNVWESACMSKIRRKKTDEDFDMVAAYRLLQTTEETGGLTTMIKGFLVAVKRVITNVGFVLVNLGIGVTASVGVGILYFFAKYLETHFDQDPATAAFLTGVVMLPGNMIGTIVGGILTSSFRLRTMGMCWLIVILSFIGVLLNASGLLIDCPQRNIAGLTADYNTFGNSEQNPRISVDELCNANCSCPSNIYQPICAPDGETTFISACHAGCVMTNEMSIHEDRNVSAFDDCKCFSTTDMPNYGKTSTHGSCPRNCDKNLKLYMAVIVIFTFVASILFNPLTMLLLRLVDLNDRSLAMASLGISYSVLAVLPAPIYFGAAIQSTCIFRSSECGQEGACLVYDTDKFRTRYIGLQSGLQILGLLIFVVAMILIKRSLSGARHRDTNFLDDEVEKSDATTNI